MSFFNKIKGILGVVAPVAANLVLPGSGGVVNKLMDTVLKDNDIDINDMTDEEKAEVISKDPELLAGLKAKAMELEAEIAKAKNENMAQVNDTMKAELKDGNWFQKGWRPFNGYMFPISVLLIYVVIPIVEAYADNLILDVHVPEVLWIGWLSILGVAVHGRNKDKQATRGGSSGSIIRTLARKVLK